METSSYWKSPSLVHRWISLLHCSTLIPIT